MFETLVAFIKETQTLTDDNPNRRFELTISAGELSIKFGYGYYNRNECLVYLPPPDENGETPAPVTCTPEEARVLLLAHLGLTKC